jgi:hypothetical protein
MPDESHWSDESAEEDYAGALSYLKLLTRGRMPDSLSGSFKEAPIQRFQARDILRASQSTGADVDDPEGSRQVGKVKNDGGKLSPVLLLVFGDLSSPLIILDGYHRLCAGYALDPDAEVPCKIIHAP